MNELPGQAVSLQTDSGKAGIGILDCLLILVKRKKLVIGVPLATAVLAGIVSFALPNVYTASTKLLPPQQSQSGAAALLSQLGGAAGAIAGSAGLKSPNDLYVAMLKSQTVADKLIAKFHLKQVYDTESQDEARKTLEQKTVITTGKEGLITISVEDEDKKRVAEISNAYVAELFVLSKDLAITQAAKRRIFYERQFEQAKNNLAAAEVALKGGLDSNGVISVDSESRAIIETVGRLRAQVSAKEVQLSSMSAFVTANNPEYRKVQEELASLKSELSRLENGQAKEGLGGEKTRITPSGLENIKLLRDVKYNQMLYELLAKQFEVARMEEANDPAIVQVLDPATEPERKSKPRRLVIILIAFIASLFLVVAWSFTQEGLFGDWSNPRNAEKLAKLKGYWRGN